VTPHGTKRANSTFTSGDISDSGNGSFCEGFRMTAARDDSAGTEAVVRKPPRKEPAGSEARLLPARYGDLIGAMTAAGQLGVPVR
jgi:hypothetical protein